MNAKTDPKNAIRPLPANLADVALIDAPTCAAAGDMSVSWWHDEVRTGRAPAPVIRESRCTRWRMSDVRAYWIERAAQVDSKTAELLTARAKKASDAAQTKRAAAALTVAGSE
jgi:predicted DNA-binding transcriptional regulator AlpA